MKEHKKVEGYQDEEDSLEILIPRPSPKQSLPPKRYVTQISISNVSSFKRETDFKI
jgi:hypothetical protein